MAEEKGLIKIKRALISVSDKKGLVELARLLQSLSIEIVSTGGTLNELKKNGIKAVSISSFTEFPEILGGRVKTLHPKVFGGILALRDDKEHKKEVREQKLKLIDLVVVNLYPFEQTILKPEVTDSEAVENIDIGGVSLIRATAKNYNYVAIVTSPESYERIIHELKEKKGSLSLSTRYDLALEAFKHTAHYDGAIANYFEKKVIQEDKSPSYLTLFYEKVQDLRYGENPHQKAALYRAPGFTNASIATSKVLSGKELSYNNIVDLDAALNMIEDFKRPFVCILKHTNPCGSACADTLARAYEDALASDPVSAFGSIIGLNRVVDLETAKKIDETFFVECVLAPGYEDKVLELLIKKKNRRFLACPDLLKDRARGQKAYKMIKGGTLLQEADEYEIKESDLKVVTQMQPTPAQVKSLLFAWKVVKHVKSNAIVLVQGEKTVGVGAGQMSRVDSVIISVRKAGERAKGSVLASDAFFPMRDGVDEAAKSGVKAIIQPGGSKGDPETIKACDEHQIAMVFTGVRHFKH
jgi:phosphoribosylaminoimidazolecarboxamide formyltransferase/IMP cyclohydrolase